MIRTDALTLFLRVERLGPEYGGFVWFSMSMSAAFELSPGGTIELDAPLVRRYLKPWEWACVQVQVAGIATDQVLAVGLVDLEAMPPAAAGWKGALDAEIEKDIAADASLEQFGWTPVGGRISKAITEHDPRNWRAFLEHGSSYPGDLAHQAGFVKFFKLPPDRIAGWTELVAAPVITFGAEVRTPAPFVVADCGTFPAAATCPLQRLNAGDLTPWQTGGPVGPLFYTWTYAGVAGSLAVTAWQQGLCPIAADATPHDGVVNLKTLWIHRNAVAAGPDWLENVEARVAAGFDLPALMIEAAQATPTLTVDRLFADAFVAALHDLAEPGFFVPPDRVPFYLDLANRLGLPPDAPLFAKVRDASAALTLTSWRALVVQVIAQTTKVSIAEAAVSLGLEPPTVPAGEIPPTPSLGLEPPALPSGELPPTPPKSREAWLEGLEAARLTLAGREVLVALVLAQWDASLIGSSEESVWKEHRPAVLAYLRDVNLRSRELLGSGGVAWRNLLSSVSDWTDAAALTSAIATALKGYVSNRWGARSGTGDSYAARQPEAALLQQNVTALETAAQAQAAAIARSVVLLPSNEPDAKIEWTTRWEGVRLQIGKPAPVDTPNDFVERIRGVGLLMRRDGADTWRNVSLAQYSIRGELTEYEATYGETEAGDPAPAFDAGRVFPVARSIDYRNGIRQVHVVYQNHALVARSPAAGLSRRRLMKPGVSANEVAARSFAQEDPLFHLWSPYARDNAGNSPTLHRLVYGQPLQLAAYTIGSSGHLPAALADPTRPWRLGALTGPGEQPPAEAIETGLTFHRTEGVGNLRLQKSERRRGAGVAVEEESWVPRLPNASKVFPVAKLLGPKDQRQAEAEPIVVLRPAGEPGWHADAPTDATLWVLPPSTHTAIWDSWQDDSSDAALQRRADVLGDYAFFADRRDRDGDVATLDFTLDDPAVAGLRATLEPVVAPKGAQPTSKELPFTVPTGATGIALAQASARKVTITTGATGIDTSGNVFAVTVPAGQLWRLVLEPTYVLDARDKFDPTRWKTDETLPNEPLDHLKVKTTIWIEVAQELDASNENRKRLHDAIVTTLPSAATRDRLIVEMKRPDLVSSVAGSNPVHRVELLVQQWRWQGRPLVWKDGLRHHQGFPFDRDLSNQTGHALLTDLDGLFFGDRDENDLLDVGAAADFGNGDTTLRRLHEIDLSPRLQAQYYRFAVIAFSRYEGLRQAPLALDSRIPERATDSQRWHRAVVPCRRRERLRPPSVKITLPLTEVPPHEALGLPAQQTPGLVVVLDESWYEEAGIGETLKVTIPMVTSDSGPLQESGSDPRFVVPETAGPREEFDIQVRGPFGYTFDTDTDAPLFHRAAFALFPTRRGEPLRPHDDYFFKLSYQRTTAAGSLAPGAPDISSQETDPVWTQVVAAANLWDTATGTRVDTQDLQFVNGAGFVSNGERVELVTKRGAGVRDDAQLWLVVTDEIVDAFGRTGQEGNPKLILYMPDVKTLGGDYVRVYEIELPHRQTGAPATDTELDAQMFPPRSGKREGEIDARARLVRASPRLLVRPDAS